APPGTPLLPPTAAPTGAAALRTLRPSADRLDSMDPKRIHLEQQHRNPLLDNEQSFQEIMAEQLSHAPWLLLSVVIHLIVIGLLWLIPAEPPKQEELVATMQIQQQEEQIVEEEEPE